MASNSISLRKLCLTTLVAVYFLIAVGGIVRATGSGMGCPDWPKCFGSWVPPTAVDQLPSDYKETYAAGREKKNIKFAKYLRALGMSNTADKILNDKSILNEADFNPTKTWIEYLNRLVGVVIGFLIILVFYKSWRFRHTHPVVFWLAGLNLLAVIFQGWFGSIVVSTNLTTWTITIHMFLAMAIVGILVYLLFLSAEPRPVALPMAGLRFWLLSAIALLLAQIYLGTQVREAIDRVAAAARDTWIASLGLEFVIHRSFSWLILLVHAVLVWKAWKIVALKPLSLALILLILGSFLTGVVMAYLGMPAVAQPVHLLLATVTFGVQLYLLFVITNSRSTVFLQQNS
ncbi:MAG: COX15/CtaA family protein [Flammeovirgaceae bacterium]